MKTPFNMIIVGMTGCRKTYYLLKMLEHEYKDILIIFFLFVQLSNITQHIRNGSLKTILTFLQSYVIRTTLTFTSNVLPSLQKEPTA